MRFSREFQGALNRRCEQTSTLYREDKKMSKFEAPTNRAFLFIKPNAATPAMEKLVETTLAARGIKILRKGVIDGPTIDAKRLIDQHYYAIASKATLLKPSELPVPEDKFEAFFGVSFQ